MAEYFYIRILDPITNLYSIDYPGEITRLSGEIKTNILSRTLIKTKCNGTDLKITIEPDLTTEEEISLDNLVSNHT